jgi:4-hydroxyphenylpyruvate dioxygenase
MRRSIATVSLSGMLREKLQAAAAARFDGVEIFENDLLQFSGTPVDVRRIADDLGLAIDMFQPFRDFDAASAAQVARSLERAERKFDVMQALGTDLILVCSSVQPDAPSDVDLLAEQFHMLAERAARRGMRIAYEALAWGSKVRLFSQAWAVVERVAHPHLGLALDSFHTLALPDDPTPIAKLPGERIFYVQLADAPWVNTDVLTHSRHYRCFPGQGEFDLTTT